MGSMTMSLKIASPVMRSPAMISTSIGILRIVTGEPLNETFSSYSDWIRHELAGCSRRLARRIFTRQAHLVVVQPEIYIGLDPGPR